MRGALEVIVLFCLVSVLPSVVRADALIDKAISAYEDADFQTALDAFSEAAARGDLSTEELLQLFEMRALVSHALNDDVGMMQDLRRLAAVRPTYRLGRLSPPPVHAAFNEALNANGSLGAELRIEERTVDGVPTMVASVVRAPEGLVGRVDLQCLVRSGNKPILRTSQGVQTELTLSKPGDHDGCQATARTKQGTALLSATIEASHAASASEIFERPQYQARTDRPRTKKKWPWYVAAAAVAVTGGVVAGVVLSKRSKDSQPQLGGVTVSW